MSDSTHRVVIVGGGLSGLATAVKLHLSGRPMELTVLEASSRPGGVIHTEVCGDFLLDHGADMFSTQPPAAIELMRQIGVEDQLIRPQQAGRGARILHRGRLVDLPDGFVLMRATRLLPILTTPLLSVSGKLRLLAERWIRPITSDDESKDVSVADFVRHRLGREPLQRIVGPLVAGIYTADIEKLSMEATMRPLAKMERRHGSLAAATAARKRSGEDSVERGSSGARYEQFRAFSGGMIKLIESLVSQLPEGTIRVDSPVESITRSGSCWDVRTDEGSETYDQVVIATPPAIASRFLAELSPEASTGLAAIRSASTAIVVLAVPRANIADDIGTFGFVVPPCEKRRILAGSFASNKFAGRAPDDHVIIRVFVGGMLQPQLLEQTDPELIAMVREELADLIGLSGEPTLARVVRWNNAMPQYHVGHRERIGRIEAAIDALPDLWLINNSMHGVGIAPVIQAADQLAKKMVESSPLTPLGDPTQPNASTSSGPTH